MTYQDYKLGVMLVKFKLHRNNNKYDTDSLISISKLKGPQNYNYRVKQITTLRMIFARWFDIMFNFIWLKILANRK